MQQKILRTGNSLAVVIPAHFVRDLGIRAGDKVKVVSDKRKSKITYYFSVTYQLPLNTQIISR